MELDLHIYNIEIMQLNHFKIPRKLVNREKYLIDAANGKSVLHLGCADYPYTDERIKSGTWLHSKLTDVSKECLGIELDESSVSKLKKNYGIKNIVACDVEKLCDLANKNKYEVIIAGEIIEHLKNPGLFLESARSVLAEGGRLIITTTNAFCLRRLVRIPFGIESVHPDHTYYFSHSTR